MEKNLLIAMVQGQIGYTFANESLLMQAFTRRSYTEENGGENNEVLEFIGDKALDLAVVKLLIQKFGNHNSAGKGETEKSNSRETRREFACKLNEGELTQIKSRIVEKKYLARRIDELGFAQGLIMGKSDIKNNVQNEASVKEDLFEAIIGAVALDSDWDFDVIQSSVEAMIVFEDFFNNDEDDNYVRLIQEWEMYENGVVPWFRFKEKPYPTVSGFHFDGVSQNYPLFYDYSRIRFHCEMKLLDNLPVFRGFGASKSEARMNVCRLAYEYLTEKGYIYEYSMKDEIEDPTKEDAVNQLEILARRGYFSIPTYTFTEEYDENGNPIWTCECQIEEYDITQSAESSSKKDAKKTAALAMLEYVLSEEDE